jgi:SGNH domain (fused to AT3 domains)
MRIGKSNKSSLILVTVIVLLLAVFATNINISLNEFESRHYGEVRGCHSDIPILKRQLSKCTIYASIQKNPIYLIGDSNVDQFSEALIQVSHRIHHRLIIATISGCPFLPGYVDAPKSYAWSKNKSSSCANYYKDAMSFLSKAQPGVVVIAFSDQYFREKGWDLGVSNTNFSTSEASRLELLRIGLNETFKNIKKYGHEILFVYTIPQLNYALIDSSVSVNPYSPSLCQVISIIAMNCDRSLNLEAYKKVQYPIKKSEAEVVQTQRVAAIDLLTDICNTNLCANRKGLFWIYRDGSHISVRESQKLWNVFLPKLISMIS